MARRTTTKGSRAVVTARSTAILSTETWARSTSRGSAYPSTNTSEAENDDDVSWIPFMSLSLQNPLIGAPTNLEKRKKLVKPFSFLTLPTELRIKVYKYHFTNVGNIIDLDPDNYKRIHQKLAILRSCRTIYHEAGQVFYSTHTFRIFPTIPGRPFKTKKPLLARLTPRQRGQLTVLELRLGPGWNNPPRGWVVNDKLGLRDCRNVRRLTVFVECDPSDGIFKGFRKADGFYEGFSRTLLQNVLAELPHVGVVHFDAWSSVKKGGRMMQGLLKTTVEAGREICWGPERGWMDEDEDNDDGLDDHGQSGNDANLMHALATVPLYMGAGLLNVTVVA